MPDLVALGEPLVEFAAEQRGSLNHAQTFRRGWGGDTSNVAVAAVRLGLSSGYITRLGGDEFSRSFLALWRQEGVDVSHVTVDPDGYTGIYFIALDEDGGHEFTYYRSGSAASQLGPGDVDPDYLGTARVLHTSGITQAISDSAAAAADAAIDAARARGITVSYDANVRPRLRPLDILRALAESAFRRADIVFLSAEDAAHLFVGLTHGEVVTEVLARGPRLVVLKQGPQGCLMASSDGARAQLTGWQTEPVDTTGAGDAFDAAFLSEWLGGRSLEETGRFANAVGALTAGGLGAVTPMPTRAIAEAFMRRTAVTR